MTELRVDHIQFNLGKEGTFSLTAPEGENPKRKLFTGFVSAEMADQLETLAAAIRAQVTS